MPWVRVNGQTVHIRMDKRAEAKLKCQGCGRNSLDKRECDWRVAPGKTCDAVCCEYCSTSPAAGKDVCPEHRIALGEWMLIHFNGS